MCTSQKKDGDKGITVKKDSYVVLQHCQEWLQQEERAGQNPTQQVWMDEGRNRQVTGYRLREDRNLSLFSQSVTTKLMGSMTNDMNNHESMATQ